MVVPWTGLDALFQANSVIIWEDFEFIVACSRATRYQGHGCIFSEGLGDSIAGATNTTNRWDRRFFGRDTPPNSKAVGLVLARAINAMIVEGGWDQDLQSPQCALRQPKRGCLLIKPQLLPDEQRCTVFGQRYKYFMLGRWSSPNDKWQPINIGVHRTVCWLAHGQPPEDGPKQECMHSCDRPECCNPAHLSWGTRAQNLASPRATRTPRK